MARLVSKIYGNALFDFAKESGEILEMCEEAFDIVKIFTDSKDLRDFVVDPRISKEKKEEMLIDLFKNKLWNNDSKTSYKIFKVGKEKGNSKIMDFISIVIDKGRAKDIVPIFEYFISLALAYENVGEATVYSARELSDEQKEILLKKLIDVTKKDNMLVDYKIDDTLIAGVKIQIGDRVYDNTYKGRLEGISKNLRGLKL